MQVYRRVMTAVVAGAMVLAAAPAFAQGAAQAQVNTGLGIGALGGVTFSKLSCENSGDCETPESGTGFVLGIWFGGNRDGRVGLMGELSYATKKVSLTDGVDTFELNRQYVEIPVLLRVNIGSRNRNKPSFYFLVGPVFDIEVSSKEKNNGVDADDTPDDFYQGLEIGLMAGAGFEVARIGIEGRYSWALRSVLATDAAEENGFGSIKLNTFSIVAKIRFN